LDGLIDGENLGRNRWLFCHAAEAKKTGRQ
jgi:hypothetical protein